MIPYELLQDLNKLACTSKNKKIEDLFLKLAEGQEKDFHDFVKTFPTRELSVKEVPQALVYLFENAGKSFSRRPNPRSDNVSEFYSSVLGSLMNNTAKFRQYPFIYKTLSTLLARGQYREYLSNYATYLSAFDSVESSEAEENAIATSMGKMVNAYESKYVQETKDLESHWGAKEFLQKEKGKREKERRERLHNTFSFFLHHFSNEILGALGDQEYWDKTKALIRSNELSDYAEMLNALPYIPRLNKVDQVVYKIYNGVISGTYLNKGGLVGAFNNARREILENLDLSTFSKTDSEMEYERTKLDYDAYNKAKGEFGDMGYPEIPETEEPPNVMMEFSENSIVHAGYILSVSLLLAKLEQGILEKSTV